MALTLHFGCAVPFVSACMFVFLLLGLIAVFFTCCLSFRQSAASLLTLHNLAYVTNLPQDYCLTLRVCVLLFLLDLHLSLFFFMLLSCNLSVPFCLQTSFYFPLSVKHVLCCHCNVSSVCVPGLTSFSLSSQYAIHLKPFSAWDVLLFCVSGVSLSFYLFLSLSFLHSRS